MSEGPYLVLPVFGPNSFRDAPDLAAWIALPGIPDAFDNGVKWGVLGLEGVNIRANLSGAIRVRERSALDPYVFTREAFRQRRQHLIFDGEPPLEGFDALQ